MKHARTRARDDREFDTTQLHATSHGQSLHRDYSAHFWRWSFARRMITVKDTVLEIGCGQDKPLSKILTSGVQPHVLHYTGVDLNKLKPSNSQRLAFMGEFNIMEDWKQLKKLRPEGYDVLVHFEVIEHMHQKYGVPFLKICRTLLKPNGVMLMSTPCYDGTHHAANHIHEYTVEELGSCVRKAGFTTTNRFGTFMNIAHIGKASPTMTADQLPSVRVVYDLLKSYYDNDALSCFFAPLYPDVARNNVWVCTPRKD